MRTVHRSRGSEIVLALSLAAVGCGGTSHPAAPGAPTALVAVAGNGQVTLSWKAAETGARFRVYYRTQPGVTKANGTRVDDVATTSTLVTGLTNDTTYSFAVTAFNSAGESAESNEVSAMPVPPGDFTQASLAGAWRFHAIAAGASPGWMRGTATVGADGAVAVAPFLDSAGNTTAPAGLFKKLLVDPSGQVRDADNVGDAAFKGVMGATNRNKIVGTSSSGGTALLAILLKHDPAVTFDPAAAGVPGDIGGFGGTLGGARRFAYSQIATGSTPQEWEFAQGQIGANNPVGGVQYRFSVNNVAQTYPFLSAGGAAVRPGDKASILSLSATDGAVAEALNTLTGTSAPQAPPPPLVIGGVMSDDKATIVATATDASGASPRYVLRIYQLINIGPLNGSGQDTAGGQPLTFALSDLAGEYGFRELVVSDAGAPATASGVIAIDGTSGALAYRAFDDGTGAAAPAGFTLQVDQTPQPPGKQNGILTSGDDASVHGKLGDFKDLLVFARTAGGASRLTIGLK